MRIFLHFFADSFPLQRLVARLPIERQAEFTDLLRAAGEDVDAGVMTANHNERKRYWQFWREYIAPFTGVDEMLTDMPDPDRIDLLLGFAHRVRPGDYGDGAQVRAGSGPVALRAIGKTFELEGLLNLTYRSEVTLFVNLCII